MKKRIFRLTHIDNVEHILQYGITHKDSANSNSNYIAIGSRGVISRRKSVIEPVHGRSLSSYIPFYFHQRMPMLYMIKNGYMEVTVYPMSAIVYCISYTSSVQQYGLDFVFTDGNASGKGLADFFDSSRLNEIDDLLDWEAIANPYWRDEVDTDKKRRKQAEFLVRGDIPIEAIAGFVVYNEAAKRRLMALGVTKESVSIQPNFYF